MLYIIEFGSGCQSYDCKNYYDKDSFRLIESEVTCPDSGEKCTCCIDCYYRCYDSIRHIDYEL